MKNPTLQKLFLVLLFALLISPFAQAQNCSGDVYLTLQEQVDAFNCSSFSGILQKSVAVKITATNPEILFKTT